MGRRKEHKKYFEKRKGKKRGYKFLNMLFLPPSHIDFLLPQKVKNAIKFRQKFVITVYDFQWLVRSTLFEVEEI